MPDARDGGDSSASREALGADAFEWFPYSLFVVDEQRRLVYMNREGGRVIASLGLSESSFTCCAVIGCSTAGTVLEAGCLTDLALKRDALLPEVRVDMSTPEGESAMWVTAAAFGPERKHVVIQMRPGIPGDRRRRTSPHWMVAPRLRICTLGRTVIESAEGPIGGAWLDQRTGQLLKYLVAERHRAVTIDEIGESIWPGAEYAVGTSVRYYVHALRRRLEPQRRSREPSAFIVAGPGTYRLKMDGVAVDADEFETHVTAGLAAASSDPQTAAARIERGLAFYRGDFMADVPYADWAMRERHHLHDLACMGLRRLADIHLDRRLVDSAARSLERLATLQPFDEDVHRRLMELDIMRGRRSDAVRRYATLRARTRRTFGHDPDFTPADLARPRLRLSQPVPLPR